MIRTAFLSGRDSARIGWTTVPLARVAESAAARCDAVHLRSGVSALVLEDGAAVGVTTDGEEHRGFDAVVLAVPPHRLAPLLAGCDAATAATAAAFTTQPIVDVHLWYEVPQALLGSAGFAALIDSPVQWVFEKAPGYLCCSLSAAADTVQLAESELARRCHASLAAVMPRLRAMTPHRVGVTRDADATFVPSPGLRRPGPRTALRNVVLAGAWTDTGWPATMESAVRSGRIAAATVIETLRRQPASAAETEFAHAV